MDEKREIVSNNDKPDTYSFNELLAQLQAKSAQREQNLESKANRITSLVEADNLLERAFEEFQESIFEKILTNQISGTADDYHNISVNYSRNQQYRKAAEICRIGIQKWTDNVDLNADLLTYLLDCGDIDGASIQAEQLQLNCPDRTKWNWRAFRFLFRFFVEACPIDYDVKAEALILDYKRVLPWDEKAYRCEADLYERKGDIENAILSLEEGINNLNAPQCALHLSDIYFERAKYDDVIRVSTLGIAYAADPQPGIRTAYLLFLRALSRDALYIKSGNYTSKEAISIIDEYEVAMKYVFSREKDVIRQRIDILKAFSEIKE